MDNSHREIENKLNEVIGLIQKAASGKYDNEELIQHPLEIKVSISLISKIIPDHTIKEDKQIQSRYAL